ncbi:phosphatidic acid phosphatase type [Aspergillus wentii]|nr:phosphatidic acid phosphatase type [Aspergillus wentii]
MQDILANVPKRLLLAYIFDWIVIIVVAIIGYGFSKATPNSNPFSLTDGSISYPFKKHETVPSHVQVFISLVGPATIIALLVLALIPGSAVSRNAPRSLKWRYRIWECNAGWMGLAVALAGAYTATHGLKNLVGKPRPDFLARCDPDLSKITAYAVGGLGQQLEGAPTLVTWEICQNKSNKLRNDIFDPLAMFQVFDRVPIPRSLPSQARPGG